MALGTIDTDSRRKIFLSISHGKVVHYLTGGEQEYFKNVEGTLSDITIKERSAVSLVFFVLSCSLRCPNKRIGSDFYEKDFVCYVADTNFRVIVRYRGAVRGLCGGEAL